jgi:sec-independent protein translocase protein TatB
VEILGVGPMELIVILLLLLVVFGPDRLPEIGAKLGKGVRSMRRATRDFSEELQQARDSLEKPASQIMAPLQELAQPVQEIAQPFQDVKSSALALSQAAKAVRDPGQAIRDSVMQSVKGDKSASATPPADATADVPVAPFAPEDQANSGDGSRDLGQGNEPLQGASRGADKPTELPNAAASDLEG